MKRRFISFLLIGIMLLLPTSTMYSQGDTGVEEVPTFTLDEAVDYAVENSSRIARVNLGLENARVIRSQSKSAVKKLDAMRDNPRHIAMGSIPSNLDVRNAELQEEAAALAIEETILRIELEKKMLTENVTKAYYSTIVAKENLQIQKDYLKNVEEQYAIAKLKADIGSGSKSDLLFAEITLDEARIDVENAKGMLEQAKLHLKNQMGMDLDKSIDIEGTFPKLTFEIEDLEEKIKNSYGTRYDMIHANNQYQLAKEDLAITVSKYPPNTFVYRLEKNNLLMEKLNLEDTKNNIALHIKSAYLAVENAERDIVKFQQTVERAKEGLRISQVSYEANVGTLIDVNNVNNQLLAAQLGLSRAIHDFNIALMEFERAITLGDTVM